MRQRGLLFSEARAASLDNMRLLFNKRAADAPHRSYANIAYQPGSRVEGVAYRLDTDAEIFKMDPFEGAPRLYSRDVFVLDTAEGPLAAWVYVANKAMISPNLKPAKWYLQHLLEGRDFLSEAYYQQLCQVECVEE